MTPPGRPFRCIIIGIEDREPSFSEEITSEISRHKYFSGGLRHHDLVKSLLPQGYEWIPITIPLSKVLEEYRHLQGEEVVIFASGDPLFNGFGGTLLREIPGVEMRVFPSFHSLQTLAHRLTLPYQDLHTVSLTGRDWLSFDRALIERREMIGVLTDKKTHTPQTIARRMLDYGYDNYLMSVGELLGNPAGERVRTMTLEEVTEGEFRYPNNLILRMTHPRTLPFGIPEKDFALLDGRVNMITKMPVRLLSLHALNLTEASTFWDVGFCTGSVSIEAKLRFPGLEVISFEKREEGHELMKENSRRFGTPGIRTYIGDFLEIDTNDLPAPDSVFLGGYGGKMSEVVSKIARHLKPGGTLVFNAVSPESRQSFRDVCRDLGFGAVSGTLMTIDDHNPIEVLSCVKPIAADSPQMR